MTGDEYLERGTRLRRAQGDLQANLARAEQSGLDMNDPHLRIIKRRLEAVTAKLDALTREFLGSA